MKYGAGPQNDDGVSLNVRHACSFDKKCDWNVAQSMSRRKYGAKHEPQKMWSKALGAENVEQSMNSRECAAKHLVQKMWSKA